MGNHVNAFAKNLEYVFKKEAKLMYVRIKLSKRIVSLLITFSFIFISMGGLQFKTAALTSAKVLDVKASIQKKDNWCWAACAEMAGRYIYDQDNGSGYRSQNAIVTYVKGSPIDQAGSLAESARGSQYACYNKYTFDIIASRVSWDALRNQINKNHTIQLGAGYYNSNGVRTGGHMVLCVGWTLNTSYDKYYIYYMDPDDGQRYHCAYNEFVDASYNGRRYDQTIVY